MGQNALLEDIRRFQAQVGQPLSPAEQRQVANALLGRPRPRASNALERLDRNAPPPLPGEGAPRSSGSAQAYDPTWGQWFGDRAEDAGAAIGHPYPENLRSIPDILPGPGDLALANDTVNAFGRGDWGQGAMLGAAGIVGLAPGVGDAAGVGLRQGARRLAGEAAPTIRAYHGSPHDFDRFSMDRIGTGEGAQAYGHGLYFAENEQVAREYRDRLATNARMNAAGTPQSAEEQAAVHILRGDGHPLIREWMVNNWGVDPNRVGETFQRAEEIAAETIRSTPGHMYEVNINADPNSLLDWDAPLSGQPHAQPLIDMHMADAERRRLDLFNSGQSPYRSIDEATSGFRPPETVDQLALQLGPRFPEVAREAGIPGIRYHDAGSRVPPSPVLANMRRDLAAWEQRLAQHPDDNYLRGEVDAIRQDLTNAEARAAAPGTRNYVIFNDSLIDIIRKYGLAAPVVGTGAVMGLQGQSEPEAY